MTPIQVAPDTTQNTATAYESIWVNPDTPVQAVSAFDQVMLSNDKLFVVLAVALIVWFGLVFFIFRTDRKLDRLERTLNERIAQDKE